MNVHVLYPETNSIEDINFSFLVVLELICLIGENMYMYSLLSQDS